MEPAPPALALEDAAPDGVADPAPAPADGVADPVPAPADGVVDPVPAPADGAADPAPAPDGGAAAAGAAARPLFPAKLGWKEAIKATIATNPLKPIIVQVDVGWECHGSYDATYRDPILATK